MKKGATRNYQGAGTSFPRSKTKVLGLFRIKERRLRREMIEVYKILHSMQKEDRENIFFTVSKHYN